MKVVLVRHPAVIERGVAEWLAAIPDVEQVHTFSESLHAVAALRVLAPELIVMETDGCESDSLSLLSWLRSHREATHTILLYPPGNRGLSHARTVTDESRYSFEVPRQRQEFVDLVSRLALMSTAPH